jgi:peptidoglycan/LPS O-acetylase OafA/YrhL
MAEGSRFDALDSWRGICALLVVLFHFIWLLPSSLHDSPFVRNAYLFVDFFFVLSGFVLCHGYRGRLEAPADVWRFAVRRFARVWPLHAVVLVLAVTMIVVITRYPHPRELTLSWNGPDYPIAALVPSVLMLNAVGLQAPVWNGPSWSIGAEFYVYLLFALAVLTAPRRLVPIALGLSAAALALIFWFAPDLMNSTWDYGTIRCIAGFFAGVAAYHVHERLGPASVLEASLFEAGAIAVVVVFVTIAGNGPDGGFLTSLLAPLVFGVAVIVFAGERGVMSLVLLARPFRALGRYSFSIYMIHQPLLTLLCYVVWLGGMPTMAFKAPAASVAMSSPDLLLADFVLGVVLLAAASHRFIETPARNAVQALAPRVATAWLAGRGTVAEALGRLVPAAVTASVRRDRSRV